MKEVLLKEYKSVICGLEGCGKSSKVFEILNEVTVSRKPVIFSYKTYSLMYEQVENWSKRYDVPKDEFAIVGLNKKENAPGLPYYTNQVEPNVISDKVRFIFMSQASLQRGGYKHIKYRTNIGCDIYPEIEHIIVDEFDFTIGVIPTLDYVFNVSTNIDLTNDVENSFYKWIIKNYTEEDYKNAIRSRVFHDKGFSLAYWLKNNSYKITFLTSETLAVKLLKSFGFVEFNTGVKEMKECKVNIYHNDLITKEFYKVMNSQLAWNSFSDRYDLIISDNITKYYDSTNTTESKNNPLTIKILNHTKAKGSNEYVNNRILTILSFIPIPAITQIVDCLNYFDNADNYTYNEIESMFYRDRLCQAIGRSLGYRGAKETDVLTHDKLYESINNSEFPYEIFSYKLEDTEDFTFSRKYYILEKIKEEKTKSKDRQKKYREFKKQEELVIESKDYLDQYFEPCNHDYIELSSIKDYCKKYKLTSDCGKGYLPALKIANYFGLKIQQMTVNNKRIRVINNLRFKKPF